jgi:hypothetical protein
MTLRRFTRVRLTIEPGIAPGQAVQLVSPSGRGRTLVRAPGLESAAWSPDGSALAVATSSASASTLVSYQVAGGWPATWLCLSARSSMNYTVAQAGWWRRGIGFWHPAGAPRATPMETRSS